ncbi:MAG: hypothetical protein A2381_11025 [Bdellovibrionales bacterium RIFOXYB1_FULL_37_110]|nr:MAG: hypothetical protein A2181_07165 [Bdellovibrionales bacterium RIFOXYA1_FULL_38_20]OFZ51197.1 MAG: hypothetical protein A2417_18010 [Bdellovibrionales bacterium RIFOXYC1_FULL_37_79]OFZ61303.1 MAG: hypothetical protein A2381_11025 [Bdellovibrionales bacterium RIFOXYB1_FULL_37_110]OFZ62166.1 MAG: hypothetical protein A2577_14600 [Bdellovibrionales bacterium RIFOXYD1_FULL_36_51]
MSKIIILLFISFNIWAYVDEINDIDGVPTLVIKDQENIIITFPAESVVQGLKFKKWVEMNKKEYLVTVWYKGAHGEVVRIFSPESKKMIYEHRASWPVKIKYMPNQIEIITPDQSTGNGIPDKYLITWTPTSITKRMIEE